MSNRPAEISRVGTSSQVWVAPVYTNARVAQRFSRGSKAVISGAVGGLGGEGGGEEEEEEEGSVVPVVVVRARGRLRERENILAMNGLRFYLCPRRLFVSLFENVPLRSHPRGSDGRAMTVGATDERCASHCAAENPVLVVVFCCLFLLGPHASLQTSAVRTDTPVRSWLPPSEFQRLATLH